MNSANRCHLSGVVLGESWTRWRAPKQGVPRGQVRFWLGVRRSGDPLDGLDPFLCAIEPHDELELKRYESELSDGRTVTIEARAVAPGVLPKLDENHAAVIFVAECCAFDGAALADVHATSRRHHAHGKMAAAADDAAELPLEGTTS